ARPGTRWRAAAKWLAAAPRAVGWRAVGGCCGGRWGACRTGGPGKGRGGGLLRLEMSCLPNRSALQGARWRAATAGDVVPAESERLARREVEGCYGWRCCACRIGAPCKARGGGLLRLEMSPQTIPCLIFVLCTIRRARRDRAAATARKSLRNVHEHSKQSVVELDSDGFPGGNPGQPRHFGSGPEGRTASAQGLAAVRECLRRDQVQLCRARVRPD